MLLTLGVCALPAVAEEGGATVDTVGLAQVGDAERVSADSLWARANAAYSNGSYRQAVELYERLLGQGMHSVKLY